MGTHLTRDLARLLGRQDVLADPDDLLLYEYDGSPEKGMPDCVVFPRSTADVVEIVKVANRHHAPIVGRGAGTGLSGGAVARNGGIVVRFLSHEPHSGN